MSCQFSPYPQDVFDDSAVDSADSGSERVRNVGGDPSPGATEIYNTADLKKLCDSSSCEPDYALLPASFTDAPGLQDFAAGICAADYDPNNTSTFILNRYDGTVNGLELLLSREDLFFLAWAAVRYQINPYFMMGILSQESAGNCAAVSSSNGEGCFQITNTFGRSQLEESYEERIADWFWTSRSGSYYPDDIFVEPASYFGEIPATEQFRLTNDPSAGFLDGVSVSSVINFNFGIIASALYFKWQPLLLYYRFDDLQEIAAELFGQDDGKASWQAAAYNGGAFGASFALQDAGSDFLDEMALETQDYVPAVLDYCKAYQSGTLTYSTTYTEDDLEWIIDLLAMTYSTSAKIDWNDVKDEIHQIFFNEEDGTTELSLVDDIKAVVYVISTHVSALAPEWPHEDSI